MKNRAGGSSLNISSPWKHLYEAAFLELSPDLLPQKIDDAQKAIAERALALLRQNNSDDKTEKEAMAKAHLALDALKRVSQKNRRAG